MAYSITHIEENGLVFRSVEGVDENKGISLKEAVGAVNKTETIDIDANTLADVTYTFDLTAGDYVEQSRTTRPVDISVIKQNKIAELQTARDATIYSSFTSSALGSVKTYHYTKSAYDDFGRETSLLAIDPTITSVDWYTVEDSKLVTHTRDQFIQVIKDGASHEKLAKYRCITLESQVSDPATNTPALVLAVVW